MPEVTTPPVIRTRPADLVGAACRLPGAPDEHAFWRLLRDGLCSVGPMPAGRWSAAKLHHPRRSERGFSYQFDGGYLEDPFGFDPGFFGLSPREAQQIDPQQRLLLELVQETLDDAGIAPATLAGAEIGVFVGASSLDYGNLHLVDPAAIDSHFMTGNTLSIIANRVSQVFDWRGPSFTVDTACSSSLVALSQAMAALASGEIEAALVAGVNLLLSPAAFIGFSRASMLSPTGLCRPFSAHGDGYVRSEGGVAILLTTPDFARARGLGARAQVLAAGLNSDGRTAGISLPSAEGQARLLRRLYEGAGIDPARLAFVEAHGTGTRVGDPAEAHAVGGVLGRGRTNPLPIGSVKSNIGHLEPASGLAGLLKAVLALDHRLLPRSLHLDELNPAIDFSALGLAPAAQAVALADGPEPLLAGVSSFGFGGTNAHVVLAGPARAEAAVPPAAGRPAAYVVSAHDPDALRETAREHAALLERDDRDPAHLARAAAHRRGLLRHRLALPFGERRAMAAALREFAGTGASEAAATGMASETAPLTAFVFSGNGAQWPGMGRAAFARNRPFRDRFGEVDALFRPLAGWSLADAMHDPGLEERLARTSVAQPLLFAIQVALCGGLAACGLKPDLVLGHSVGEVAAAHVAGALALPDAVRLIWRRSEQQEKVAGRGHMAVVALGEAETAAFLAWLDEHDLCIAAVNAPSSVTLSGSRDAIERAGVAARGQRIALRRLDLDYPFHSAFLDPVEAPLVAALRHLGPRDGTIPFVSTVTGAILPGSALGPVYWWRNIREPVRFQDAVEAAVGLGAGIFLEIGPRAVLANNVAEILGERGGVSLRGLGDTRHETHYDPVTETATRAFVHGARVDPALLFGPPVKGRVSLPRTPWQRRRHVFTPSAEALDLYGMAPRHPLIGARLSAGTPEWRNLIDMVKLPWLADHAVDGKVVLPAAAFAEMLFAAGRELMPEGGIGLDDVDILQPLVLVGEGMREVSLRWHEATRLAEIRSRPRLADEDWTLHVRGRIVPAPGPARAPSALNGPFDRAADEAEIYRVAAASGMTYGPAFRLARGMVFRDDAVDVELAAGPMPACESGGRLLISSPFQIDAAFHTLFQLMERRSGERRTYLPIRFGRFRLLREGAVAVRAELRQQHRNAFSLLAEVTWHGADGGVIATLDGGLFRSTVLERTLAPEPFFHSVQRRLVRADDRLAAVFDAPAPRMPAPAADAVLLLDAFCAGLAHRALSERLGHGAVDSGRLADGVAPAALPLAFALVEGLEAAGLLRRRGADCDLAAASGLPEPERLLATFAAEAPDAAAELLLGARALAHLGPVLDGADWPPALPGQADLIRHGSLLVRPLLAEAEALVAAAVAALAPEPVRVLVLEPSCGGLLALLAPWIERGEITLALAGGSAEAMAEAAARHGRRDGLTCLGTLAEAGAGRFDLVLGLAFSDPFGGDPAFGRRVMAALAADGAALILQPRPTLALDILLGGTRGWFTDGATVRAERVLPDEAATRRALAEAGFRPATAITAAGEAGILLLARPGAAPGVEVAPVTLLLTDGAPEGAILLPDLSRHDVLTAGAPAGADALDRLAAALLCLAAWLSEGRAAGLPRRLLVVADAADPAAEALRAFLRTATNEYPEAALALLTLAPDLCPELVPYRVQTALALVGRETELLADATGLSAPLIRRGLAAAAGARPAPAARLQVPPKGLASRFAWQPHAPVDPGPGEIAIAVAATGLNFRDVMLAMGLLDDDVLDAGLAGAVLGFECAGTVMALGEGVDGFQPGDRVMGFAARAFASRVTGSARAFVKVPAGVAPEAAAALPVAFLTAWYALVEVARLKAGESVLIQGAAGGVGLAAIQIARMHGARIVAGVGSADKAALARFLGAEHVTTSRSPAFAEDVRRELGGVDVVLNSLAGEAMLAGIGCLKPFGRFIELGKRDYVLNTSLGLRPFRRNLSYFGIDIDQLLACDPALVERLMGAIGEAFARGELTPLPYRLFPADEAGEAFRLMQAAGHVGKIVVAAPAVAPPLAAPERTFAAGPGWHVVVGGTSGFGFETALWLAERGARRLLLCSRRGELGPDEAARAGAWRARGVEIALAALDVTDRARVDALIAGLGAVAGIVHCAASMDDGLIAGLDADRLGAVLAPKLRGAENLDAATAALPLHYFVMFSSATTLVGSPGQGAYVAANGWLEGLARRRRARGRPALAVAWGAIADAGMLARDPATAERLERLTGVAAMPVAEALGHLGRLMADPACEPVVTCAGTGPDFAGADLAIFATPVFAGLAEGARGEAAPAEADLAGELALLGEAEAQARLTAIIVGEAAQILRLPRGAIDPRRGLADLGMDSLMGLELRIAIEKSCGVELPTLSIGSGSSIADLAGHILELVRRRAEPAPERAAPAAPDYSALVARHMPEAESGRIAPVAAALGERLAIRKSAS